MKTQLVVTGYIFHENKLLLIHHKKLNLWLPVGGHIEENELEHEHIPKDVQEIGKYAFGFFKNFIL